MSPDQYGPLIGVGIALLVILLLALLWFAPVLVPSITAATLLPYDNLSTFDPWRSLQAGRIPYNDLLSDLVLQNAAWKLHLRESLAAGEIPLWNPKILTGVPFLAGGQASALVVAGCQRRSQRSNQP